MTSGKGDYAKVGDPGGRGRQPVRALGGSGTAGIISASGCDIKRGPYDDVPLAKSTRRSTAATPCGPTFNLHGQVIGTNPATSIRFRIGQDRVRRSRRTIAKVQVVVQLKERWARAAARRAGANPRLSVSGDRAVGASPDGRPPATVRIALVFPLTESGTPLGAAISD